MDRRGGLRRDDDGRRRPPGPSHADLGVAAPPRHPRRAPRRRGDRPHPLFVLHHDLDPAPRHPGHPLRWSCWPARMRFRAPSTRRSAARKLALNAVSALRGGNACLLGKPRHGCARAHPCLQALRLASEVETLASQYWHAAQLGAPHVLDREQLAEVRSRFAGVRPGASEDSSLVVIRNVTETCRTRQWDTGS